MSNEKMRDEFEAWAFASAWLGIGDVSQTIRDTDGTGYLEIELHTAWLAWQASRESLVIELPKAKHVLPIDADRESAWDICKDACIDAIEAAGLKVKP